MIKDYLGSVHIKDRKLNGPSTPLNEGIVNFYDIFSTLQEIKFHGPLSYQIYRNRGSDNLLVLKESRKFINRIIDSVAIE